VPLAMLDGLNVFYRLEGAAGRPVVVLSHSLGLDHGMWDLQMPALLRHFRVLRYDTRGHGATDAPDGDYTVEMLGGDALALLDRLEIDQVAWVGVSLGGFIGQWIAAHAPDRLTRLVLANTTARIAEPAAMDERRRTVLSSGMAAIAGTAMSRFFVTALIDANPPHVASARETVLRTNPVGYAGCCAALRDADLHELLPRIQTPTLVVSGEADEAMPWPGHGGVLASHIRGARAVRLATAHISNLGLPRTFTRVLLEFLAPRDPDASAAGEAIRRAILGNPHVDRAHAQASDLTRGFQDLITAYVWGEIWTRPGLDHVTRRLLVLTTTAALGRWEEFRLHLTAGLAHDVEWTDVEEVLLQVAIYAGVPAANTAFHIVEDVRRTAPAEDKPRPPGSSR
jgi:3-oxoadipate enol-lactonase/4-carboxymuconolactone decarboxylase